MGIEVIIGAAVVLATGLGSFLQGKRSGRSAIIADTAQAVTIMKEAITELRQKREEDQRLIAELNAKMNILESLVTQKAEVQGVREVVDRIAMKVGA